MKKLLVKQRKRKSKVASAKHRQSKGRPGAFYGRCDFCKSVIDSTSISKEDFEVFVKCKCQTKKTNGRKV